MEEIPLYKLFLIPLLLIVILLGRGITHGIEENPIRAKTERQNDEIIWVLGDTIQATMPNPIRTIKIAEITKYNNHINQTWGNPNIMASGKRVYEGAIACPDWLPFGTVVEIASVQYVCEDRMNIRYRQGYYFDIFTYSYKEAIEFGRQIKEIVIYD